MKTFFIDLTIAFLVVTLVLAVSFAIEIARRRQAAAKETELSTRWSAGSVVVARWVKAELLPAAHRMVDMRGEWIATSGDHWTTTVVEDIELGLRSDGVVVWRTATKR